MAVRIKSITFDCADPYRLAQFWSQLTGFSEDPDNGNAPGDPEALLLSPDGSLALLFIAVPEPRHVKNRVHLDLVPLTSRRDEEVGQLLRIGARMVDDQRRPDGGGWVVLCDDSAAALQAAFGRPGVLERTYRGPLGTAAGAERLQIRLYDLLAHGWDLAQATGQPAGLPDDLAEQSLAFARTQLTEQARPGRFGPARIVAEQAPAIERLAAFLGRPVKKGR